VRQHDRRPGVDHPHRDHVGGDERQNTAEDGRRFTSGNSVLTVNTFMPTGGVSMPISIIMTTKMPNQSD